jgi:hypothetical protein
MREPLVRNGAVALMLLALGACAPQREFSVLIGDMGVLDSGTQFTAVADSRDSFKDWLDAEIDKDQYGKANLTASKKAFLVSSGTKATVLEWERVKDKTGRSVPVVRVRFLDGQYGAGEAWAAASEVHKIN